ncbi:MAG: hypothetical protein IRZ03_10975 [Acidobacterium ailaaui]|nr:hypothetical protein [Pseudacidobacterium ailaaui]
MGQQRTGQNGSADHQVYWNTDIKITPFRLPPPPAGYTPQYIDLDGDGTPDILKTITKDSIPVMWIDDNGNMKYGDISGDVIGDCLLIDRNKDGRYDLIIDWVEGDSTQPPMQVIADYPFEEVNTIWSNGHYMWVLDTDYDHVFNYINWDSFKLESWAHSGCCNFFPDYSGKSMFMKVHAATNRIEDLRMNWENPFLFYDPDHDGLSEMAIRLVDSTSYYDDPQKEKNPQTMRFSGKINWVSISVDMDNDNGPENEFDFDFTLGFRGGGFDYMDQVHSIDMHSLPGTYSLFPDPRFRHLKELIYTDHEQAMPLIFNRGKWQQVYFVYDEDDDCHRWERVEFYEPLDPFRIGTGNGGIDDNPQSDPAGDRGEWDLDNSGKGRLYISRFDGRLHLYGAEWGVWRIDQTAAAYQGWDRSTIKKEPKTFATVKYEDTDNNGFFDKISYDLDGDTIFETIIDLKKLGIDDRCELIDVSHFKYSDYVNLQKQMSQNLWEKAHLAMEVAQKYKLDINWYIRWQTAITIREQYHNGYWLQFYIYKDLEDLFLRKNDEKKLIELNKAYYSGNWNALLN